MLRPSIVNVTILEEATNRVPGTIEQADMSESSIYRAPKLTTRRIMTGDIYSQVFDNLHDIYVEMLLKVSNRVVHIQGPNLCRTLLLIGKISGFESPYSLLVQ